MEAPCAFSKTGQQVDNGVCLMKGELPARRQGRLPLTVCMQTTTNLSVGDTLEEPER